MRCWVRRDIEYPHVGMSLAWWLLDDGSWLAVVVGTPGLVRLGPEYLKADFDLLYFEEVGFPTPSP